MITYGGVLVVVLVRLCVILLLVVTVVFVPVDRFTVWVLEDVFVVLVSEEVVVVEVEVTPVPSTEWYTTSSAKTTA